MSNSSLGFCCRLVVDQCQLDFFSLSGPLSIDDGTSRDDATEGKNLIFVSFRLCLDLRFGKEFAEGKVNEICEAYFFLFFRFSFPSAKSSTIQRSIPALDIQLLVLRPKTKNVTSKTLADRLGWSLFTGLL